MSDRKSFDVLEEDNGSRLDMFLFRNGILPSRNIAREEIQGGNVSVNGKVTDRPGAKLSEGDKVIYSGEPHGYVSRGAYKLIGALERFGISPSGKVCLDVGASTGGFTQVLLERGALRSVCIDVGHGQLDKRIEEDDRVVSIEGFNFRNTEEVEEKLKDHRFSLVVCDVSFISLKLLTGSFRTVFNYETEGILLIKPQFEAGRSALDGRGIIRDQKHIDRAVEETVRAYEEAGFKVVDVVPSPIKGGDGNTEFLMYIKTADRHNDIIEDTHNPDDTTLKGE